MGRIEPVPADRVDPTLWARVVAEADSGQASVELAGVLAYHHELFRAHVQRLGTRAPGVLLGPRLSELVRLRSAQLGGCAQCQAARYGDSVDEDDVACLVVASSDQFTAREQIVLEFVRLMHVDHYAIDDAFYRSLHAQLTVAEIVELGLMVAGLVGTHRFLLTLDLLSAAAPAIAFDPADVFGASPLAQSLASPVGTG